MSNRGEGHACVRLYVRVSMCLEIPAGTGVTEHSTAARDSLVRVDRVALYLYPIQITLLRIERCAHTAQCHTRTLDSRAPQVLPQWVSRVVTRVPREPRQTRPSRRVWRGIGGVLPRPHMCVPPRMEKTYRPYRLPSRLMPCRVGCARRTGQWPLTVRTPKPLRPTL